MFNQEVEQYNDAIKEAGYEDMKLKYEKPVKRKSRRLRKIYWFNPPFSKIMSSDLTKMFNGIMIKNFPNSHILHKIINKNNTKISYSTTANMAQIIAGHNKKLIKEFTDKQNQANKSTKELETCNCRRGSPCPLDGKCLTKDVLYKATCSAEGEADKEYIGISATEFKDR